MRGKSGGEDLTPRSLTGSDHDELAAPILLYHATFSTVPKALERGLHNVAPALLFRQLEWVKNNFDVVFVDELFRSAASLTGKCAITFDDGYQCVFDEALPILEALNLRATIFINGVTLAGQPMWRDKIRYLLNLDLAAHFIEENYPYCQQQGITAETFYRSTKKASVNSGDLDRKLSEFLVHRGVALGQLMHGVAGMGKLIAHPLLSYGDHSWNHYVLSSLCAEQQQREIGSNHHLLQRAGLPLSKLFAAPFGGSADLNETTVRLCREHGYEGILCSSSTPEMVFEVGGLERCYFRKRYMPPPDLGTFQGQLGKFLRRSHPRD